MDEAVRPVAVEAEEEWTHHIPDDEWAVYKKVIDRLNEKGIDFSVGGGFARAIYSHYWRNTKDLDIYIRPSDRDRTVEALTSVGLADYFDVEGYDRGWIYRSHQDGTIVDTIWSMANYRAEVDERWVTGGPMIVIRGELLRVVPVEEMIWAKLYIIQRPRCDWPDIINMLYGAAGRINWSHLAGRLGPDLPLLAGVLSTFGWVCPGRAASLPPEVWDLLHLPVPAPGPEYDRQRADIIDSRPWLVPAFSEGNRPE